MSTRTKSKFITLLLALLMFIIGFGHQTVFAADSTQQADTLKNLGLFRGTDAGYELDKPVTRGQAAVMLVRLLGVENEALNGNYSHPFTDVPKWADKYVAYMYDNGLTKGMSNKLFDPNGICSHQMYSTFMLRALAYEDGVDFTFASAMQEAQEIGLFDTATSSFLRGDMVAVSYSALATRLKNSDLTLLDKLVADGAVDARVADSVQRLFATSHSDNARIKLILDNEEFIVDMYDNPTSRDFLTMLPITLSFEDFVGKEKISYLSRKLDTEPAPSNSGPSVGEFAYYAPWGNLAIFYNESASTGNGLIVLGKINSGMQELEEKLADISDNFKMTIERID
ncbi:Cyclophilin-like [Paenibacillus sophorae]|uniref:Cyclophilin-like n=1 Tax=Paenibacillus sophorae TaxID=1333845 RepID=A0A1H8W284_9BACL|nr:cyclophilin-like fold protein [Paenibacillus sophorae]QWU13758.1 S-layer homology domain-containing protein [Paenibacillus sophorae]SEP21720.1 Cyclophilin-like [Paenibacillus sophorae]